MALRLGHKDDDFSAAPSNTTSHVVDLAIIMLLKMLFIPSTGDFASSRQVAKGGKIIQNRNFWWRIRIFHSTYKHQNLTSHGIYNVLTIMNTAFFICLLHLTKDIVVVRRVVSTMTKTTQKSAQTHLKSTVQSPNFSRSLLYMRTNDVYDLVSIRQPQQKISSSPRF